MKHTLATYVYSHCNICNTRSTFATSRYTHMQHTSETHKTYGCNMCSSTCSTIIEARSSGARRRCGARSRPRPTGADGSWHNGRHEERGQAHPSHPLARGTRRGGVTRGIGADASVPSFGVGARDARRWGRRVRPFEKIPNVLKVSLS